MKKKQIDLSKKLSLKKDAVAALNVQQQNQIAGGVPLTWWSACCVNTREVTCPDGCVRTSQPGTL
ncbi:class I lanthipeptide [Chitinophaga qingshengii]|uniref:Class I lanthipeptide n=1 Tax=Chitinophaga qingshengii TaxID=1569794 RepID=A0ABR7TW43_9BACT|nr:class I lanthipeptide [Chitinophaga qingshengii]MBC9934218.1 class I lanthipeptide [Chitinophaga qingshengii]